MKAIFLVLLLINFVSFQQNDEFAVLDKSMYEPISYSTAAKFPKNVNNKFVIERKNIGEFLNAINKVEEMFSKKNLPPKFDFNVGSTRFFGLKLLRNKEERMDVVITTQLGKQQFKMHLCDENVSLASNAYFIKTFSGYIKENIKK